MIPPIDSLTTNILAYFSIALDREPGAKQQLAIAICR
jgi:hypothetical protein